MPRKNQSDKPQMVRLPHSKWITLLRAVHIVNENAKTLRTAVYGDDPHGPACWAMELAAFNEVSDAVTTQISKPKV